MERGFHEWNCQKGLIKEGGPVLDLTQCVPWFSRKEEMVLFRASTQSVWSLG